MPNPAYSSAQTVLGLAIQTERGTPVDTPTFWVPVRQPKYEPDLTLIPDETLQGSEVGVYDLVLGMRYDKHGWESYPYLDSFPVLVRAELGSADTKITASTSTELKTAATKGATTIKTKVDLTAGTFVAVGSGGKIEAHKVLSIASTTATLSTPLIYTQPATATVTGLTGHKFSLLNNAGEGNQPPPVTLWDYDGERCRQLSTGQLTELTIKGNATGLVTYTCSWFANPAKKVSKPATSFSSIQALPGWSFQAKLGTSAPSPVIDWTFPFKRGVKPIPALTGTQEYLQYFANVLQSTGKMTVVAQATEPELTAYLAGVQQALDFTVFDVKEGFVLDIHSSKAQFKTGSIDRSKEWVQVPLDFQLLPTTTDATAGGKSPCTITVWNSHTGTY